VMRSTFRLALAAILTLACGTALASGRRAKGPVEPPMSKTLKDSFPDAVSYPATRFGDWITGELADRFYDLSGAGYATGIMRKYYGSSGRLEDQRWRESGPQGFLTPILPGVRFFHALESPRCARDAWPSGQGWVYTGTKLYRVDALNRVLLEAGFSFDSTEMPTIAKAAVLFAAFGKSFPEPVGHGWVGPPPPERGFPAITFLSMKREEKHYSGAVGQGIRVQCIINGIRVNPYVALDGADKWGRRQVDRVFGGGLDLMMRPVVPFPPPGGN